MSRAMIFNIQRFSVQDGPGIRSTVFFKGCPLRCIWCSNPESQHKYPEVSHRNLLCSDCAKCVEICDPKAIAVAPKKVQIDRAACNNCGKCVEVCAYRALSTMGKLMTVQEVLEEVFRDLDFYRNSGGGITASGGEPCMQAGFLATLFEQSKRKGLHTTLDTCGYASTQALRRVLKYTDLVLFDMKLMDDRRHRAVTGRSNATILRNVQEVDAMGVPLIIRVPLIPSVNCFDENIHDIARFVKGLKRETLVNILPYHRMGLSKYENLDREYVLNGEQVPSEEYVGRIRDMFRAEGTDCEICH